MKRDQKLASDLHRVFTPGFRLLLHARLLESPPFWKLDPTFMSWVTYYPAFLGVFSY